MQTLFLESILALTKSRIRNGARFSHGAVRADLAPIRHPKRSCTDNQKTELDPASERTRALVCAVSAGSTQCSNRRETSNDSAGTVWFVELFE